MLPYWNRQANGYKLQEQCEPISTRAKKIRKKGKDGEPNQYVRIEKEFDCYKGPELEELSQQVLEFASTQEQYDEIESLFAEVEDQIRQAREAQDQERLAGIRHHMERMLPDIIAQEAEESEEEDLSLVESSFRGKDKARLINNRKNKRLDLFRKAGR